MTDPAHTDPEAEEPPIAVVLVNYRDYAKRYLPDLLDSLAKQSYGGKLPVYIVDNEYTDDTIEYLKDTAPDARILRNHANDGFAKGCNDGMRAAMADGHSWLFVLNMDTVFDEHAVRELARAAKADDKIAATQARLHLFTEKDRLNSLGNATHYLGFGHCLGYRELAADRGNTPRRDIFYPSGAAVLLRADALLDVGLFDESLWMYNEDQDLGWRLWLGGWRCVLADAAVVYHRYQFGKPVETKKYYWMDRNRVIAVLKNDHILTLLVIAPAFLVMELGHLYFAARTGWLGDKLRVWGYFFRPAHVRRLFRDRRRIQSRRKIRDRDLAPMTTGAVWYPEIDSLALRLANPFFAFYWRACRAVMFW